MLPFFSYFDLLLNHLREFFIGAFLAKISSAFPHTLGFRVICRNMLTIVFAFNFDFLSIFDIKKIAATHVFFRHRVFECRIDWRTLGIDFLDSIFIILEYTSLVGYSFILGTDGASIRIDGNFGAILLMIKIIMKDDFIIKMLFEYIRGIVFIHWGLLVVYPLIPIRKGK